MGFFFFCVFDFCALFDIGMVETPTLTASDCVYPHSACPK
jgi:hypothetical protein